MVAFLRIQYQMERVTDEQLKALVIRARITREEYEAIVAP